MLQAFLLNFRTLIAYFAIAVLLILTVKFSLKPDREVIRKLMHTVCVLSIFVLVYAFNTWYLAASACILFAVLAYPALWLFERLPQYGALFNQRRDGEVKMSLILVFFMMAALITLFWGVLGPAWKYVIIASVTAWGFGDAAAALIGLRFGRHKVTGRWVEGTKSWEGFFAMYGVAVLSIFLSLILFGLWPWQSALLPALLIGLISAATELLSRGGMDTVNVPFATALSLFGLIQILLHWSVGL